MQQEYPSNDQRLAVCSSQWEGKKREDWQDWHEYAINVIGVDGKSYALTAECATQEDIDNLVAMLGAPVESYGQIVSKRFDPLAPSQRKLIIKDNEGFERIVFAEVLIPDTPNTYGDYHTKENIREIAYTFMVKGFKRDVNHNNVDVSESVHVIESFIARQGDPDFIEGSWVVGMLIQDDGIWEDIKQGRINGYSWEGYATFLPIEIVMPDEVTRTGQTEPDLEDGHYHHYFVLLDDDGRVIAGGTTVTNGHSHTISGHTKTEIAQGHRHRYNFLYGENGY